jgi:hypothetical protein
MHPALKREATMADEEYDWLAWAEAKKAESARHWGQATVPTPASQAGQEFVPAKLGEAIIDAWLNRGVPAKASRWALPKAGK